MEIGGDSSAVAKESRDLAAPAKACWRACGDVKLVGDVEKTHLQAGCSTVQSCHKPELLHGERHLLVAAKLRQRFVTTSPCGECLG